MYQDNREEFDKHYHRRSIVEAAYAAIKAMYGDSLRTRLLKTQTVETMMQVINYNVEMVTSSMIKAGSLTEQDIQAVAAC